MYSLQLLHIPLICYTHGYWHLEVEEEGGGGHSHGGVSRERPDKPSNPINILHISDIYFISLNVLYIPYMYHIFLTPVSNSVHLLYTCVMAPCEDRVLDRPASGEKGSKDRNWFDCIPGNGVRHL